MFRYHFFYVKPVSKGTDMLDLLIITAPNVKSAITKYYQQVNIKWLTLIRIKADL